MSKRFRYTDQGDGLTGALFEYEVLGRVAKCVGEDDIKYLPYAKAIDQVKTIQAKEWDPADPPTDSANDLHATVALKLELEDWSELKLFNAVGQALDIFHGVDAFFEYKGAVCTIDLSLRNKGGYKADVEVAPKDLEKDSMRFLAGDIAMRLKGGCDVVRM